MGLVELSQPRIQTEGAAEDDSLQSLHAKVAVLRMWGCRSLPSCSRDWTKGNWSPWHHFVYKPSMLMHSWHPAQMDWWGSKYISWDAAHTEWKLVETEGSKRRDPLRCKKTDKPFWQSYSMVRVGHPFQTQLSHTRKTKQNPVGWFA